MLLVIKISLLSFFLFIKMAQADEKGIDSRDHSSRTSLSWVKDLNVQAEKLAQTYQIEAKAIVQDAINSSSQQKHCQVAKDLAHQAEDIVRENLELSESEHSVRYPQLLVFISFSMPVETLKTLASQVNQAGGKVVLRGLVNGSFKNTAEKIKELQQEVIIDPTLFESYQIKVVPTFVLREKNAKEGKEEAYDQLSGNVSLEYVLEQFSSLGTTRTEALHLLKALRSVP